MSVWRALDYAAVLATVGMLWAVQRRLMVARDRLKLLAAWQEQAATSFRAAQVLNEESWKLIERARSLGKEHVE